MKLFEISSTLRFLASLALVVLQVGSQDLPQDFLNAHNAARKEVGVPSMTWDNVLEAYALNYSKGKIDNCQLVRAVGPTGQNLAWGDSDLSGTDAVQLWTQVIWINSTQLGCAKVRCRNNGTFIACYYYPPGNVVGTRPTEGIESVIGVVAPRPQIQSRAPSPQNQSPNIDPPKESKNRTGLAKNRTGLVIVLSIGASALIFSLCFTTWFISRRKRKRENEFDDHVFDMFFGDEFGNGMGPRKFSLNELAKVTSNFNAENKLGEGGFGSVYRGFLRDSDTYIAVKKVSRASKQGIKEYASEVKIISRLRHKNLVKLIGWCHERGELMLVYEFMANGSLDSHIFKGKSLLTWEVRYRIVKDLASASLYLHEGDHCVLHRDINTSNIMLDSSFNAKLGDFGLARLVDHAKGLKKTLLAGTVGYMAPECLSSGKASKESDVYSFGVVALEIASGRRSIEPKFEESEALLLVPWVWESYGNERILDVADRKLGMAFYPKQLECLVMVGLWCAHPSHNLRPSIRQVIQVLNFEAPLPNLPGSMPIPNYNDVPITPGIGSSEPLISNITITIPR
ncbi:PREDICTED: L-type lectin-domain containing receptor kinase IX.1 [Theobroma cacao]|uniref:L-type lectin-domain containing receptor kinase IX.1 n=1 Tax=Theobroma cacao TaxID=3641 RepID=A0AB32WYA2_THECC|nr:PREDICTED: L-type lectin-domain containing receptor kinase IX.1 [Theobroma cacao]